MYKEDWKPRESTSIHIVRAQTYGCLPDYYAPYCRWSDAQVALREYAAETGLTERNGPYRYDDPVHPFYAVHDTITLGETGIDVDAYETVEEALSALYG